jgi:hypothetical protein
MGCAPAATGANRGFSAKRHRTIDPPAIAKNKWAVRSEKHELFEFRTDLGKSRDRRRSAGFYVRRPLLSAPTSCMFSQMPANGESCENFRQERMNRALSPGNHKCCYYSGTFLQQHRDIIRCGGRWSEFRGGRMCTPCDRLR